MEVFFASAFNPLSSSFTFEIEISVPLMIFDLLITSSFLKHSALFGLILSHHYAFFQLKFLIFLQSKVFQVNHSCFHSFKFYLRESLLCDRTKSMKPNKKYQFACHISQLFFLKKLFLQFCIALFSLIMIICKIVYLKGMMVLFSTFHNFFPYLSGSIKSTRSRNTYVFGLGYFFRSTYFIVSCPKSFK